MWYSLMGSLLMPHLEGVPTSSGRTLGGTVGRTINYFAVQAEVVAMETLIDVGNILWIFYDCLSSLGTHFEAYTFNQIASGALC